MSQQQQKPQPDEAREWANDLREWAAEARFPENEDSFVRITQGVTSALASLLESQAERIEVLRRLVKYAAHHGNCRIFANKGCSCGYLAALTAAGVKTEETK
jgi:hypothetical protein